MIHLPEETLMHILSQLEREDLSRVSRVCKKLRNLASDRLLSARLYRPDIALAKHLPDWEVIPLQIRNVQQGNFTCRKLPIESVAGASGDKVLVQTENTLERWTVQALWNGGKALDQWKIPNMSRALPVGEKATVIEHSTIALYPGNKTITLDGKGKGSKLITRKQPGYHHTCQVNGRWLLLLSETFASCSLVDITAFVEKGEATYTRLPFKSPTWKQIRLVGTMRAKQKTYLIGLGKGLIVWDLTFPKQKPVEHTEKVRYAAIFPRSGEDWLLTVVKDRIRIHRASDLKTQFSLPGLPQYSGFTLSWQLIECGNYPFLLISNGKDLHCFDLPAGKECWKRTVGFHSVEVWNRSQFGVAAIDSYTLFSAEPRTNASGEEKLSEL